MVITEVRVKLMDANHERLLAFCSITLGGMFVIRDLKIIDGLKGIFIAMPSRKLTDRCPECAFKNHLRARFCNRCGLALDEDRALRPMEGRVKLHADIAHPIHSQCRDMMQRAILKAYDDELERAKLPGYVCRYDEIDAGDFEDHGYEVAAYRVHAPHREPAVRSSHLGELETVSVRDFGAGILDR